MQFRVCVRQTEITAFPIYFLCVHFESIRRTILLFILLSDCLFIRIAIYTDYTHCRCRWYCRVKRVNRRMMVAARAHCHYFYTIYCWVWLQSSAPVVVVLPSSSTRSYKIDMNETKGFTVARNDVNASCILQHILGVGIFYSIITRMCLCFVIFIDFDLCFIV